MYKYFNKYSLLAALVAMPAVGFAADGGGSDFNPILIGLITLIIILLFGIGMLGSTLAQLGIAYKKKLKEERSSNSGAVKALLLLIAAGLSSTQLFAQDAAEAAPQVSKAIAGLPAIEFYMLMGTIALELIVMIVLMLLIKVMIRALTAKPGDEQAQAEKAANRIPFWDRFHSAVAVEHEEDIMLDHDYDGIKELDNSLPPWWKYGFYVTIVIAFIYIWYYHLGSGPSSREEFLAEMKRGEKEVAAYLAKSANNVDENTVEMLDEAGIAAGQDLFSKNCIACHGPDGGGNAVGPNLADAYWLHKGGLKDIFKSIKYGWTDKGMRSWKDDFSPKQIAQLASYVKSLQGTTPTAPKEPQGELYVEAETTTDDTAAEEAAPEE